MFWRFGAVAGVDVDVCCSRFKPVAALRRVLSSNEEKPLPRGSAGVGLLSIC